jgi:hypothetical protein
MPVMLWGCEIYMQAIGGPPEQHTAGYVLLSVHADYTTAC